MDYVEQIEEYFDNEDSKSLLKLVPEVLEQSSEVQQHLYKSLAGMVGILYHDDDCGRLFQYDQTTGEKRPAHPEEIGIWDLIQARERIAKKTLFLDRGEYYCFLTRHSFFKNQPLQVLAFCRLCEQNLLEAMQAEPDQVEPLWELALAYDACAQLEIPEKETYLFQALDLWTRACLHFSDLSSWNRKFYFLNEPREKLSDAAQTQWQAAITAFFNEVRRKTRMDPFFAITLGEAYQNSLENTSFPPADVTRVKAEWLALLEWGMAWTGDNRPDNLEKAGHLYSKAGQYYENETFLLKAEKYFRLALEVQPRLTIEDVE